MMFLDVSVGFLVVSGGFWWFLMVVFVGCFLCGCLDVFVGFLVVFDVFL